jgi:uncharacterized membrane protein YccC
MSRMSRFVKDIRRLDKSAFSLTRGFRAAAFVIAPIIVDFAIVHQPRLLVLATLGAVILTNTEMQLPAIPSWILLVACFTEAVSFGLGTLVATTGHSLTIFLLGIGVFVALIARVSPRWTPVGTFTAVIFAIGVGLPGYSIQSAGLRILFSLIGMLWALIGVEIHRLVLSKRIKLSESQSAANEQPMPRLDVLRSALMIGIASALGYTIGLVLGLPRDFWTVVTIIIAIRPNISATTTFTSMIVIGTIVGALIALITLENSNLSLRLALLFSFAVALYATMKVNVILTQIFLVPFIIILLNIYYPGEWYLSFIRILDVAIGGAIAVAMVCLLSALSGSRLHSHF